MSTVGHKLHSQGLVHIFKIKALHSQGASDVKLLYFTQSKRCEKQHVDPTCWIYCDKISSSLCIKKSKTPSVSKFAFAKQWMSKAWYKYVYVFMYLYKNFWLWIILPSVFWLTLPIGPVGKIKIPTCTERDESRGRRADGRASGRLEPLTLSGAMGACCVL